MQYADRKFSCKIDLDLTSGIEILMNLYMYNWACDALYKYELSYFDLVGKLGYGGSLFIGKLDESINL
jgi:hypothetical protein